MTEPDKASADFDGNRGFQSTISLAILGVLLLIFIAADAASRSQAVSGFFTTRELAANGDRGAYYLRRGIFFDENDYFWYRRVEPADFSAGGVYLFGASGTSYAFDPQTLGLPIARVVHNFGYSGANPAEVAQLIEYLARTRGLLSAGPAKTRLILGFGFFDLEGGVFAGVFPESVQRSGIRDYLPAGGITNLELSPFNRFLREERARTRSVALRIVTGQRNARTAPQDAALFHQHVLERLGSDWPEDLQSRMPVVDRLLGELQAANVPTEGVLLPLGSWCDDIPLHSAFDDRLRHIFAQHNMTLTDLSHAVPDDGFRDPYHLNARGAARIQDFFISRADEYLRANPMR